MSFYKFKGGSGQRPRAFRGGFYRGGFYRRENVVWDLTDSEFWFTPRISSTLNLDGSNNIISIASADGNSSTLTPSAGSTPVTGGAIVFTRSSALTTGTIASFSAGTFYVVAKITDKGLTFYNLIDGISSSARYLWGLPDSSSHRLYAGNSVDGGTIDTSAYHIYTLTFDGVNSNFRQDGVSVFSGNSGSHTPSGFVIGARYDNTVNQSGIEIKELGFVARNDSLAVKQDIESELSSLYGIAI